MPRVSTSKKPKVVIGIDPGASGAICVLPVIRDSLPESHYIYKMPNTQVGIFSCIASSMLHYEVVMSCIEKISPGFPGSGKLQIAKLYGNYRELRMALVACNYAIMEVTPATWKRKVGLEKKGKTETRTDWKNRAKAKASEMCPGYKFAHATAEAYLIAQYCRDVYINH